MAPFLSPFPKIIYRYLFKEIAVFFSGCLAAFTGILFAVNLLKFASLIVAKGVNGAQIGMVFLSLIPTFLEIAIPMAMLLGVMLAFARLSGDSELIVLRASGVSLTTLIRPVALFGILVTALSLSVSFIGRPWGYNTLNSTLKQIASTTSTAGLDEGVFAKFGDMTMYCETIDHSTGKMSHVLLDDRRDETDRKIIFARSGTLANDQQSNQVIFHLFNGEVHEEHEGKYAVTNFEENVSVISADELMSNDANKKGRQLSSMDLDELTDVGRAYKVLLKRIESNEAIKVESVDLPLGQAIAAHQINKKEVSKRINRVALEAGRRLSMPFAALVLALVGMSLGIQPPRTQRTFGIGLSAVFGLLVFVIYYGFLSVGIALAESGTFPPTVALWLPNLVVLALASVTLYNLGRERWHSVTEAVEVFVINQFQKINRWRNPS